MPLSNKIALVAGGAGGVGEGIVRALLKANAVVVVPSRSETKLTRLRTYVADVSTGKLVTVAENISTEEGADAVRDLVRKSYGALDLVVASLGGWWQGQSLTELDLKTWNTLLTNNLTSHFLAINRFVPLLLPETGVYVHVNGFSAEQAYPKAAPVAMSAAAQKSLVASLAAELEPTGIRVYELILGPIKARDRLRHGWGKPDWYAPEEIGDYLVRLVTGTDETLVHRLLSKTDE